MDNESGGEFQSVVVRLEYLGPGGPVGTEVGYWVFGWLNARVENSPAAAVWSAHDRRAVSISPWLDPRHPRVLREARPGQVVAFRISFLDAWGFLVWQTQLAPGPGEEIQIGPHRLRGVDWTLDPADHPLAGRMTIGDLVAWGAEHADTALALDFLTPTVFKQTLHQADGRGKPIDIEIPLPDPARIVASLAGRWAKFAPAPAELPEDLVEELVATTALSRHEIRTEQGLAKGPIRGFVGRAEFRCLSPDPGVRTVFALLWKFAAFAGLGNKTAHGLGLVWPSVAPRPVRASPRR